MCKCFCNSIHAILMFINPKYKHMVNNIKNNTNNDTNNA